MSTTAWVDGCFVDAAPDLAPARGVFETLAARAGRLPLWERHLARLVSGAQQLGIPCAPPPELHARARELLARNRHGDDVLRITLGATVTGASWSLTTRARPPQELPVRLCVVRAERPAGDHAAALKCTQRAFYDLALARARAAGADDALLVAPDGTVLETTRANVLVAAEGALATPRLDGRVLPGIARAVLIEGCTARGLTVHERDLTVADLDSAEVWITNAVFGPRPAVLPGGVPPVGGALCEIWRDALAARP